MTRHGSAPLRTILQGALLVCLAFGPAGVCQARSPWTQDRGEGFFQLAYFNIGPYDRLYRDSGGDFVTSREITESTLQAYGEYGLTDRLSLLATIPYASPDADELVPGASIPPTIESGSRSRPGNVRLGARYRFARANALALSGQLDLDLPADGFDRRSGLSSGYDAFTLAPSVALGRGWKRAYVSGYVGFGLRSDDFSNDWRVGAEGGYSFFERLWLIGVLDVRQSFSDGDVVLDPAQLQTGLYVNDQEFVGLGAKALLDITPRVGLQLTYQGAAQGNNVPRSPLVGLGVSYKLRRAQR